MNGAAANDEDRRLNLELQAALPAPSQLASRWSRRRREPSEGRELAAETLGAATEVGLWAILLAAPGAVVWWRRRRRAPK